MRTPGFSSGFRSRLAVAVLAASWLGTGFFCAPGGSPAGLPGVFIDTLRLELLDPAQGSPGAHVAWSAPSAAISSLELYQSLRSDSLGAPVLTGIPPAPASVDVALPDSSPPFTVYFALRAVQVDPTGEKNYSDTLELDSLLITAPPGIYQPANGDTLTGRTAPVSVLIGSDPGATLRQAWYEDEDTGWAMALDTCLPRSDCLTPLFGTNLVTDTIELAPAPAGGIHELFCVLTTEVISTSRGLRQSLGCSRFTRQ